MVNNGDDVDAFFKFYWQVDTLLRKRENLKNFHNKIINDHTYGWFKGFFVYNSKDND